MKIAIHSSTKEIHWKSCQRIFNNLAASYAQLGHCQVQLIGDCKVQSFTSFTERLDELMTFAPNIIVFLGDTTPDTNYFKSLLAKIDPNRKIRLIFHCLGDFSLSADEWLRLEPQLANRRIKFLMPSSKAKTFFRNLVAEKNIGVLPLPINEQIFQYRDLNSNEAKDHLIVLYTGRISLQKNLVAQISALKFFADKNLLNIVFRIAGVPDDIGAPYFGIDLPCGKQLTDFWNTVQSCKSNFFKVEWLGPLNDEELIHEYYSADFLMSLSTYHDEDFGMSVGEALMCGLPVLISNWGGFSGFSDDFIKSIGEGIRTVPIEIGDCHLGFKMMDLEIQLSSMIDDLPKLSREKIATNAKQLYSIAAISKNVLPKILSDPFPVFEGFLPMFSYLATTKGAANRFKNGTINNWAYRKLYGPYWET